MRNKPPPAESAGIAEIDYFGLSEIYKGYIIIAFSNRLIKFLSNKNERGTLAENQRLI
jgi:hypothetical protein